MLYPQNGDRIVNIDSVTDNVYVHLAMSRCGDNERGRYITQFCIDWSDWLTPQSVSVRDTKQMQNQRELLSIIALVFAHFAFPEE